MSLIELIFEKAQGETFAGRIFGAVTAVVSNVTIRIGSVASRSLSLAQGRQPEPVARIVSFMAGAGRRVFRPETGDEVLVLFEHGDMRSPT